MMRELIGNPDTIKPRDLVKFNNDGFLTKSTPDLALFFVPRWALVRDKFLDIPLWAVTLRTQEPKA